MVRVSYNGYTARSIYLDFIVRPKQIIMLPSHAQNLQIGSVGRFLCLFFFYVRELSFPIFFFKFLNGENAGGMQSKRK